MIDEERLYEHVRKRIKDLRNNHPDKKTTQDSLAKAIGIKRSTLTNIEIGNQRPPLHVLYRLCRYFDVPLDNVLPSLSRVGDENFPNTVDAAYKVGPDKHVLSYQSKTRQTLTRIRKLRQE